MSAPYHCWECPASFAFERGAWMHTVRTGHSTDASPMPDMDEQEQR